MKIKEFINELLYAMQYHRKPVQDNVEAEAYTREQLLNTMRRCVDTTMLHKENNTYGFRAPALRPTTISKEYYDTLERLGASEKFLTKLKPIVRD